MENKQSLTNIAKAILSVMSEVKNIDKTLNVGTGVNSYKGIADAEVKLAINEAMSNNGLVILPIDIEPKVTIERWEEEDNYSKIKKTKQSVFTEVKTKYLLMHESGESVVLSGYGHGVDTQDKSAGKATTYALKNTLLYTFLIATTKIDDTDTLHSDNIDVPQTTAIKTNTPSKPYLNPNTTQWLDAVNYLKGSGTIEKIKTKYLLSKVNEQKLMAEII